MDALHDIKTIKHIGFHYITLHYMTMTHYNVIVGPSVVQM